MTSKRGETIVRVVAHVTPTLTNSRERCLTEAETGAATTLLGKSARKARPAAEDAADEIESAKSVLVDCMDSLAAAKDGLQSGRLPVESAVPRLRRRHPRWAH
jgi:hypothetical protein